MDVLLRCSSCDSYVWVWVGWRRAVQERKRTYRTKEETEAKKPVTATVVLTLLFISVVVPMLQYFVSGRLMHAELLHATCCTQYSA